MDVLLARWEYSLNNVYYVCQITMMFTLNIVQFCQLDLNKVEINGGIFKVFIMAI